MLLGPGRNIGKAALCAHAAPPDHQLPDGVDGVPFECQVLLGLEHGLEHGFASSSWLSSRGRHLLAPFEHQQLGRRHFFSGPEHQQQQGALRWSNPLQSGASGLAILGGPLVHLHCRRLLLPPRCLLLLGAHPSLRKIAR